MIPHPANHRSLAAIVRDGDTLSNDEIPVRFTAAPSRVGPISVGQENMRLVVLGNDPDHINACLVWEIPAGTSRQRVADTVGALLMRHESLRTTYPAGQHTQLVHSTGELRMAVHAATSDPAALAETVGRKMRALRFDPATELPLRLAVVTSDGEPVNLVVVLCHVAADAAGLDLLCREWTDLIAGRTLPTPTSLQPLDVAEMEHAPAGQRRIANSLRYWHELLQRAPQAMFAAQGVGETDWMLPRLQIRSTTAADALARISDRTGAGRATVVLAAMAALVAFRFDQRTCVISMLAANRFMPEMRDYVGTVAQDAAMSVQLDTTSFDEVIRRVRSRSLAANRHSWFDSAVLWQLMDDVGAERGTQWARDCVFNDLTALTLHGLLNVSTSGAAPRCPHPDGDGAADTRLAWMPAEAMPTRLMLWATRLEGEVELSLWADPRGLPRPDAENFGTGIVRLLLAAAQRDVDLTGLGDLTHLQPVSRGPGWYVVDSCWVDLAAVQSLLAEVLPQHRYLVTAQPDPRLGHRIDCYVAAVGRPADQNLTPEHIHAACMQVLRRRRHPAAMAPHQYVICERAPADCDNAGAWRKAHVVAEGTGRAPQSTTAATEVTR